MKIIDARKEGQKKILKELLQRKTYPKEIEKNVAFILDEIRKKGDRAVTKFAKIYDKVQLSPGKFRISEDEINSAEAKLDKALLNHIRFAVKNIQDFAKNQIPKSWKFSPRKGVTLGEKFTPMDRVACYVPGGAAPLISTVIHTAAIAKIAGVKEIIASTPPSQKGIHPALLYAMKASGVTEAYRLGGVYAIGAFAYGTETIKKVDKIVGPGNAYVTAAKKIVYGEVGIDMAAGPSEIMIIADESAKPEFIAADILSQAEHGSGHEQAVLISTDENLCRLVISKIKQFTKNKVCQSKTLNNVLKKGVYFIIVKDIEQALDIAGEYAPEHLEIMCKSADKTALKVKAAGAIFIGEWTPEPSGDYIAGPSHVLPTGASARFFSGLSTEQFFRRSSIIKYEKKALQKEIAAICAFADAEGLRFHGLSAAVRRETDF